LLAGSSGQAWRDVLVHILSHQQVEESLVVPAVAEPLIVWILSGSAIIEERELGGTWTSNHVKVGDFFLTNSDAPYEMRWQVTGPERFEVMHLYLGLPIFEQAVVETLGTSIEAVQILDISGKQDRILSLLLEQFQVELTPGHDPSPLFVQGIAQSLAVHLVRRYAVLDKIRTSRRNALPAFKLRRVTERMAAQIDQEFCLSQLALEADMSVSHFSRLFKKATSFSPSQYFIQLRVQEAQRLLRETDRSVIDVGLDVGYSSPSHFAQVFRRAVGVSPTEYRG
jgi:AraC family transcriptional regulator